MKRGTKMYPRVKVRIKEQDDSSTLKDEGSPVLVKISQPPSLHLHAYSAKENQNDTLQLSVVKIPEAYVPKLVTLPLESLSKGPRKSNRYIRGLQEDTKLHIRANFVPRPRAVVSSPDNDKMIGKHNKQISKRPLAPVLGQYSTSQVKALCDQAASPFKYEAKA